MAHHTLTLNWSPTSFRPDIADLPVHTGDTVTFQLGTTPSENCNFKITLEQPELFSVGEVTNSNTVVTVVKAAKTSYRCQLFDARGNQVNKDGQAGGGMRPA